MRYGVTVMSAVLLLVGAGTAGAEGNHWFGVSAGTSIPVERFKQQASPGYALAAEYAYMVTPHFGIGAEYQFHRWGTTEWANSIAESYYGPGSTFRFNSSAYLFNGTIILPFTRVAQPFIRFGGGWYNPNSKVSTDYGSGDQTWSYTGFDVGGGLRVAVNRRTHVGVLAAWQQLEQLGDRVRVLRVGGQVQWKLPRFGEDLWGTDHTSPSTTTGVQR